MSHPTFFLVVKTLTLPLSVQPHYSSLSHPPLSIFSLLTCTCFTLSLFPCHYLSFLSYLCLSLSILLFPLSLSFSRSISTQNPCSGVLPPTRTDADTQRRLCVRVDSTALPSPQTGWLQRERMLSPSALAMTSFFSQSLCPPHSTESAHASTHTHNEMKTERTHTQYIYVKIDFFFK